MAPGINRLKTWVLIAAMGGLFVLIGSFWGRSGATVALVLAVIFNFAMYWFSDKIAIATTRSKPVTEREMPDYYRIVRQLATEQNMPMPKLFVSEMQQPNAFATGRNPEHASVAVTRGILQLLDERELRGVLAHELSHVANRDILISSIAAAIGMSITFLARFAFFFGGDNDRGGNIFALLLAWILAPIAAMLIQMAVTRSREYQADESGAFLSRDPDALASALIKLEEASRKVPPLATVSPAEAHMFIVNPMNALQARGRGGISSLFRTHPPTEARVERLRVIASELRGERGPIG
ncbi:MAG TPA: zinc metalloprotease HtpX [Actinomycetota bacterium]|nr:zinc metalloprotease HtpX [Actinomycetota bacterium]